MALATTSTPVVVPITGSDMGLADQGVFFTAVAPTPGTGIVGPVATTLVTTTPLLSIYNSGQLNIYPKFLRLHVSVVGTTGAIVQFTQVVDSGNRYASGGSILTPHNTAFGSNGPVGKTSAIINFGAITAGAATGSAATLHHTKYRSAIEVVDDVYQFSWGSATQLEDPMSLVNNTTTLANVSYNYAPIVIGPGCSFLLYQWRASITVGITFDVELGYVEK
jgi:hypothetical protein